MANALKSNFTPPRSGISLILWIITVVCILGALISFFLSNVRSDIAKSFLEHGASLQILSQQIAKNASEAAYGNRYAFRTLGETREDFTQIWQKVSKGDIPAFLPLGPGFIEDAEAEIEAVEQIWGSVRSNADTISEHQQAILDLHKVADIVESKVPALISDVQIVVETLLRTGATSREVHRAQDLESTALRLIRGINTVLDGTTQSRSAALGFKSDIKTFNDALVTLEANPIIRSQNNRELQSIRDAFNLIREPNDLILNNYEKYAEVKEASSEILQSSSELLSSISDLTQKIDSDQSGMFNLIIIGGVLSLIAVMVLLSISYQSSRQTRARLSTEERVRREQEETNRRNQEAILRLLDELSALADGDLTIQTTVTGEFTGAICDSINFTIEQLRSLVSTINDTAVKVSSSAQETQSTAMQLAEASEHQAQEISGASAAITEMASSIDQVSANAAESALVAERSVTIANKGSQVVHNTTRGMDTIREQIQETAKRIKRLGESSQEIGDIVSLITDIADQTNILALNAAIQASMAGDAGRGFAVVADEVQRLAERSSAATKQIEAIVRTIQTDTNEAVTSMEHTTAEVVRGTRLAQDAGIALEEIENVSRNLADLIQNISNAARQQAASAGHISNTMNVIQEITSQTSNGTIATAKSIGNLAGLAVEMRKTVAGFKLPEN